MPTQQSSKFPKTILFSLEGIPTDDHKSFINAGLQRARAKLAEAWEKGFPEYKPNKGGAPSKFKIVKEACDAFYKNNTAPLTKQKIIEEVTSAVSAQGEKIDPKTVARHVDEWMGELPMPDIFQRFKEKSGFRKRNAKILREAREEIYINLKVALREIEWVFFPSFSRN